MSKLENRIKDFLIKSKIDFEEQKSVPIDDYPWKTNHSKTSPKADLYLPKHDLYIEIKGFMTYQAVSKLSYLSRQNFRYYIFQGTEPQWNPYIDTFLDNAFIPSKAIKIESNIKHQLLELINLDNSNQDFLNDISKITLKRLKKYIDIKIEEYKSWNGEWY
jgi:hypothetical protein